MIGKLSLEEGGLKQKGQARGSGSHLVGVGGPVRDHRSGHLGTLGTKGEHCELGLVP